MKPRILFVNESSALNTGYSTYGREILSRLHNTGKYDIAELATYILPYDSRLQGTPWKVFLHEDKVLIVDDDEILTATALLVEDAELIVLAVNTRDLLLEAAVRAVAFYGAYFRDQPLMTDGVLDNLRTAINAAKGNQQ